MSLLFCPQTYSWYFVHQMSNAVLSTKCLLLFFAPTVSCCYVHKISLLLCPPNVSCCFVHKMPLAVLSTRKSCCFDSKCLLIFCLSNVPAVNCPLNYIFVPKRLDFFNQNDCCFVPPLNNNSKSIDGKF